jgi:hypothetical protein
MVGAGVEGRSHLDVLAHLCAGTELVVASRRPSAPPPWRIAPRDGPVRARRVDDESEVRRGGRRRSNDDGLVWARPQTLPRQSLSAAGLVVSVDYDMCVPAATARAARTFLTDDVGQLLATRHDEVFAGYPDPDASIGQALLGEAPPRAARTRARQPPWRWPG